MFPECVDAKLPSPHDRGAKEGRCYAGPYSHPQGRAGGRSVTVFDSLGCSDHGMVSSKLLREETK